MNEQQPPTAADGNWAPPPPPAPGPYATGQPPAGYATPVYQQVVPVMQTKTNGLAIAALVLGIVWVYWIGSILAVIFGHVALGQINRSGGVQSGRGMAIAGLVLGWIGVAVLIVIVLAGAAVSSGA